VHHVNLIIVIPITDLIKMSSALLELPKTDQYRKTPEGVKTARVLETGLLKISKYLILFNGKHE
jgi:hypothetical protein